MPGEDLCPEYSALAFARLEGVKVPLIGVGSEVAVNVIDTERRDQPVPTTSAPQRLDACEVALVTLEGVTSLGGLAGGAYMMSHELTVMPLRYLSGTFFHTWRWPGVALFIFVGVAPALVVMATLLRRRVARVGHLCVGLGLVAWIVLEATWVVWAPVLQGVFFVTGLVITVLGVVEWRRSGENSRK